MDRETSEASVSTSFRLSERVYIYGLGQRGGSYPLYLAALRTPCPTRRLYELSKMPTSKTQVRKQCKPVYNLCDTAGKAGEAESEVMCRLLMLKALVRVRGAEQPQYSNDGSILSSKCGSSDSLIISNCPLVLDNDKY